MMTMISVLVVVVMDEGQWHQLDFHRQYFWEPQPRLTIIKRKKEVKINIILYYIALNECVLRRNILGFLYVV